MISNGKAFLNDKAMTRRRAGCLLILSFILAAPVAGQRASSLNQVQNIYIGSLGPYQGAEDLRLELEGVIHQTHRLHLVQSPDLADAVLEGHGELWLRGYHSLSPRARVNPKYAEPLYGGYLSVKLQGKNGETLWSYLANPGRISFDDLKHELANQIVNKLVEEIAKAPDVAGHGASANLVPASGPPLTLQGAGATFPLPIYQDWFASFHARYPRWEFVYKGIGSEAGVEQLLSGASDFAGSDIPPDALTTFPGISDTHAFPSVGGAVVLIYNIPDFHGDLELTPDVITQIFTGKIGEWNDPALRALNRRETLPRAPIRLVHRADGSGTTFTFTDYLTKASAAWKQQMGRGQRVRWPVGEEATGNEGVANFVANTKYSLGYVEFIYALGRHLSSASLLNASGRYLQADLPSIMAAANSVAITSGKELDVSITNASAPDAYPISTFSWLMFGDQLGPEKKAAVMSFLEWMLTSGQRQCSALGYAPLPQVLLNRELAIVRRAR